MAYLAEWLYSRPRRVRGLPWFRAPEVVIHVQRAPAWQFGRAVGVSLDEVSRAFEVMAAAGRAAGRSFETFGAVLGDAVVEALERVPGLAVVRCGRQVRAAYGARLRCDRPVGHAGRCSDAGVPFEGR